MILDPIHYLSPVFRDWQLPACFADFRAQLEQHYGAAAGGSRGSCNCWASIP